MLANVLAVGSRRTPSTTTTSSSVVTSCIRRARRLASRGKLTHRPCQVWDVKDVGEATRVHAGIHGTVWHRHQRLAEHSRPSAVGHTRVWGHIRHAWVRVRHARVTHRTPCQWSARRRINSREPTIRSAWVRLTTLGCVCAASIIGTTAISTASAINIITNPCVVVHWGRGAVTCV